MPMERNRLKSYTPIAKRLEKLGMVSLQFPFDVVNCQHNTANTDSPSGSVL